MMNLNNCKYNNLVTSLCDKYYYDQSHAKTVARLSISIFNKLKDLHMLGEKESALLRHAALLHDIGYYVSIQKHHKHAEFLVLFNINFDLYPEKERLFLSILVRSHRKTVKLQNKPLTNSEKDTLSKLIAILRIADSLDYLHYGNVTIPDIIIDKENCIFKIDNAGISIVREKVDKKAEYFKEVYDLNPIFSEE